MLFTNKTLEIVRSEEGKKLELFNMYGKVESLSITEPINDKILFVQDSVTHKYLDLNVSDKGIEFQNVKSDKLYLVLDLLEYKFFKTNTKIETTTQSEVEFDLVDEYKFNNRLKTNWTITILEVIGNGFGCLKLTTTSGRNSYLLVNNKIAYIANFRNAKKYIEEHKIDFNIEKAIWE